MFKRDQNTLPSVITGSDLSQVSANKRDRPQMVERPASNRTDGKRENPVRRDLAIDVIRGLALLSMAVGHVIESADTQSVINQLIHWPLLVDGASGFVFLSGVSVALSDRARIGRGESHGKRMRWLLLRAAFIYSAHVVLTTLALLTFSMTRWPEWASQTGLSVTTFVEILTFGRLIRFLDILPIYVFFLLATALLIRSSTTRALQAVGVLSAIVYVVSLLRPEWTSLHAGSDDRVAWVVGTWQVLFFGGFIAGSRWSELRTRLNGAWRRGAIALSGSTVLLLFAIRAAFAVAAIGLFESAPAFDLWLDETFPKPLLPPPLLAVVVGFGVGMYILVTELLRRWPHWFRLLVTTGARSLRVYLVSCVSVVIAGASFAGPSGRIEAELLAIAAIVGCVVIAQFRAIGKGNPWSI